MAKTVAPFNVNSSGWTNYVVQTVCKRIRVQETAQAGTTDYYVASPTVADGPMTKVAGQAYEIESQTRFIPGEIPFSLKTVTGSVNFDGDEQ